MDWYLVKPRQLRIPLAGVSWGYGVWLVSGRIHGGGDANGQIGTWIRYKIAPQASGLYISYDAGAKAVEPDLGARFDPDVIVEPGSGYYDTVVACAEKAAPV